MAPRSSGALDLGAASDVAEALFDAGLTDGLPVTPPTRQRVQRMLCGTALKATDVIGQCPPSYFDVTAEKLAIAAVMAGCTPEMFRIVVAAARAMLRPEFGLHGVHATTMGATPVVIVNGPCRQVAGVNFRHAPCGSGSRSTSIGRALKLVLQNIGRAKLAGTESTTLGTPMKFGVCFGEWEERSVLWEPLSVTSSGGEVARGQDAVTVFAATSGPVQMVDFSSSPDQLVDRLAQTMAVAYSPTFPLVNHCLLLVSPEHHDTLVNAGMTSKTLLAEALWRRTARCMVPHLQAVLQLVAKQKFPKMPPLVLKVVSGLVALALQALAFLGVPITAVPKFSSPDSFRIVVAGGDGGKFSAFMPSFGLGKPGMPTANMSVPVTVAVEPRPGTLNSTAQVAGGAEELLDPRPESMPAPGSLVLAKRSGGLDGPVALMDISKARGSELLDAFEAKLKAAGVATRRFMKPTFCRPCPEALLKEMASCCKSAILALAD